MHKTIMAATCILLVGCSNYPRAKRPGASGTVLRLEYRNGSVTSFGTAFLIIDARGRTWAITAAHVVYGPGRAVFDPAILAGDPITFPALDVAAFPVTHYPDIVNPMPHGRWRRGEACASGYPYDGPIRHSEGGITKCRIASTCTILSGMSGGPLIQDGRVVGVTTDTIADESGAIIGGHHASILDVLAALE